MSPAPSCPAEGDRWGSSQRLGRLGPDCAKRTPARWPFRYAGSVIRAHDRQNSSPATTAVTEAILSRRSVRTGFRPDPIPKRLLAEIVECGMAAPSSKNSQPWRLHVVTDRMHLDRISSLIATANGLENYVPHDPNTGMPRTCFRSTVRESAEVLASVPAAIFLENAAPFSEGISTLAGLEVARRRTALFGYGLEMLGIGASLENMWLSATSLGLRAAFLGDAVIAEEEIRRDLQMNGDLVGVLAVGFSTHDPRTPMDRPADESSDRVIWHTLEAPGHERT